MKACGEKEVARGRHCRDRRPDGPQFAIKERLIDLAADYGALWPSPSRGRGTAIAVDEDASHQQRILTNSLDEDAIAPTKNSHEFFG